MAMMERFSVSVMCVLLIVMCGVQSKPQSYSSKRPTNEQRPQPRPAPTNEVYSSQLNQPTPPPQRRHTTPSHGVPASGRQSVAKHGIVVDNTRPVDVAVSRAEEERAMVYPEGDNYNRTQEQDMDALILEIFKEEKMLHDRSVAVAQTQGRAQDKGQQGKSRIKLPVNDPTKIVFPTDAPTRPKYLAPRSPCPDGLTICSGDPNYPDSYLRNLLKRGSAFESLFVEDVLPVSLNITQRLDSSLDEEQSACPSVETLHFPRKGQNRDDNWLYIVQNEGSQVQGVRVENCRQPEGSACNNVSPMYGYESFCKQKYIFRKMVAMSPTDGNEIADDFRLPSCCSCHVRLVDLSTRMGFDPTTQSKAKSRRRRYKSHQQDQQYRRQ